MVGAMRSGDQLTGLKTEWRLSERGIFRDREAERLDLTLASNLRLVDVAADGLQILYIDLTRGEYRELRFSDRPDGCSGSASLTCVSVDYVKAHYRRTPGLYVAER